ACADLRRAIGLHAHRPLVLGRSGVGKPSALEKRSFVNFDYDVFTTRNMGFASRDEQKLLRNGRGFIAGVGGMAGACLNAIVRAGVGQIAIADIDRFEISNLNRQVFAFTDTVGQSKTTASAEAVKRINPELDLHVFGAEWTERLPEIAASYKLIVNACDDIPASVPLYRVAAEQGATVIDAYTSPLPSVTLVRPTAPRPEQRLRYPSVGKAWGDLSEADVRTSFLKEVEYVLVNSSSARHVDLQIAAEMAMG